MTGPSPGATRPVATPGVGPSDILVSEVFSAIQGEAALVGERQVFVRLTGCNIRCSYCDQPEALERVAGPCRIERTAGRRDWSIEASPLRIDRVVEAVGALWSQVPHHSISLTGGEPLLQGRRVERLAERFAGRGWPVMLETNGTLLPPLRRVGPRLAYVSMDLKLRSVDGELVAPSVQARFLAEALASGATTWVKVVVGPGHRSRRARRRHRRGGGGVGRTDRSGRGVPAAADTLRDGDHRADPHTGARAARAGATDPPPGAGGAPDPQGHRAAVDRAGARTPDATRGRPGTGSRTAPSVGTTWLW